MPEFFIYLIKANIALTIFYLAYRLGLRRLTFYTLNRLFLLFGIAFSAIFPLVDLAGLFDRHQELAASVTHYSPDWYALEQYLQPQTFTVWTLVRYLFWAGVIIMAVRFCIQLFSLLRIHLRTTAGQLNQEKVRLMSDTINPFSFFKNIYINPSLHSREEIKDIIIHEKTHVNGWHTADILAGEINNIFYWFNPGAWMMKTAIRENLEFITDRKILQSGVDAKTYQYNLIKVSRIPFAVSLANNFNFSPIRQRIAMMNKKRSSGYHLLRYFLIIPAVTVIVFTVSLTKGDAAETVSFQTEVQANTDQNKLSVSGPGRYTNDDRDTIPEEKGSSATRQFIKQNPSVKVVGLGGVTNEQPTVLIIWLKNDTHKAYDMNNPLEKKEAERLYGKDQVENIFREAKYSALHSKEDVIAVEGHSLYASRAYQAAKEKDYDKATAMAKKALQTNPDDGEARQVLKYVGQMKAYQQKVKDYQEKKSRVRIAGDTTIPVRPTVTFTPPKVVKDSVYQVKPKVHFTPPKVVKDSVYRVKPKVHFTPPKAIEDTAISHSGKIQSAQSIIFTSANRITGTTRPGKFDYPLQITGKPLFIVDGVQKDSTVLKTINPNDIYSITVLKGVSATSVYGDKAKNGAVLITTQENKLKPIITQGYKVKNDKAVTIPPEDTTSNKHESH